MMDSKSSAGLRPATTKKRRRIAPTTVDALGNDVLCMIFSFINLVQLIRCSAVCKSWGAVINKLKLLQIQYHKQHQTKSGSSLDARSFSERLINIQMEQLATERQRLSLQEGGIDIFQWKAHSVSGDEFNKCRMKMGLILSGVGEKEFFVDLRAYFQKSWLITDCKIGWGNTVGGREENL
ncbi:hypothetical protein OROGR_020928 [Orobanche gracilis]